MAVQPSEQEEVWQRPVGLQRPETGPSQKVPSMSGSLLEEFPQASVRDWSQGEEYEILKHATSRSSLHVGDLGDE